MAAPDGEKKQQNVARPRPFRWTPKQLQAARLLAANALTDVEIARQLNLNRASLRRWRRCPEFLAKIQEEAEALGGLARQHALALRARRLKNLETRHAQLMQILHERAADPALRGVP